MRHQLATDARGYLIQKTSVVFLCRALGVTTGFLLDAAILAYFGLGNQTDAFFAALAIPFLIDATLSVQFTQVIVPMLAGVREKSGESGASSYLSNIISIWVLSTAMLAMMGMAISKLIMPLQVPGWSAPAIELAVRMNMVLVWLVPVYGLAALLGGALYSKHQYWLSSSTKAINNLSIITVAALGFRSLGIYALAWGHVAGAVVQCAVLWIALARDGFRFRIRCNPRDLTFCETAKLVFYPLAGQMLGEMRTLIENFCMSFYAPGALSALRYAARIITALSGMLMSSVVTATTPMVAHFVAERDYDTMKRTIRSGVKLLMFMSLPVALWLVMEGNRLVAVLFERGKFSGEDAALTSKLMALMTPYILFSRIISITQTPFYAVSDTKTLILGMIWGFLLYLVVVAPSLYFFGVYGFPLATSAAAALGAVVMCYFAQRRFGAMGWDQHKTFLIRLGGALSFSCVGFWLGNRVPVLDFGLGRFWHKALAAGIPSLLGVTAFGIGAVILRLADLREISSHIRISGIRGLFRGRPARAASKVEMNDLGFQK